MVRRADEDPRVQRPRDRVARRRPDLLVRRRAGSPRPRRPCPGGDALRGRVGHEDGDRDRRAAPRRPRRAGARHAARRDPAGRSAPHRPDASSTRSTTCCRTRRGWRAISTTTTRIPARSRPSGIACRRYHARRPADLLPLFIDLPAVAPPGTEVRYNDAGFVLAGLVIEAVAGRPWDAVVADEVFRPAGMVDTGTEPLDERSARPRGRLHHGRRTRRPVADEHLQRHREPDARRRDDHDAASISPG